MNICMSYVESNNMIIDVNDKFNIYSILPMIRQVFLDCSYELVENDFFVHIK